MQDLRKCIARSSDTGGLLQSHGYPACCCYEGYGSTYAFFTHFPVGFVGGKKKVVITTCCLPDLDFRHFSYWLYLKILTCCYKFAEEMEKGYNTDIAVLSAVQDYFSSSFPSNLPGILSKKCTFHFLCEFIPPLSDYNCQEVKVNSNWT